MLTPRAQLISAEYPYPLRSPFISGSFPISPGHDNKTIYPVFPPLLPRSLVHPAPGRIGNSISAILHPCLSPRMLPFQHRPSRVLHPRQMLNGSPSRFPHRAVLLLMPSLMAVEALPMENLLPCTQLIRSWSTYDVHFVFEAIAVVLLLAGLAHCHRFLV